MSIRGIDTQIMIARTSDVSRDTSALQKKPEVTQDYQAIASKLNEEVEQKRVQHTSESEMEKLHADKDGGGKGSGGGDGRGGKDREDEAPGPGMIVAPGNHRIDIIA